MFKKAIVIEANNNVKKTNRINIIRLFLIISTVCLTVACWFVFSFKVGYAHRENNKSVQNVLRVETDSWSSGYPNDFINQNQSLNEIFTKASAKNRKTSCVIDSGYLNVVVEIDGVETKFQNWSNKTDFTDLTKSTNIISSCIDDKLKKETGFGFLKFGKGFENDGNKQVIIHEKLIKQLKLDSSCVGKKISIETENNQSVFKDFVIVGIVNDEYNQYQLKSTDQNIKFWMATSSLVDESNSFWTAENSKEIITRHEVEFFNYAQAKSAYEMINGKQIVSNITNENLQLSIYALFFDTYLYDQEMTVFLYVFIAIGILALIVGCILYYSANSNNIDDIYNQSNIQMCGEKETHNSKAINFLESSIIIFQSICISVVFSIVFVFIAWHGFNDAGWQNISGEGLSFWFYFLALAIISIAVGAVVTLVGYIKKIKQAMEVY